MMKSTPEVFLTNIRNWVKKDVFVGFWAKRQEASFCSPMFSDVTDLGGTGASTSFASLGTLFLFR